ncbi:MAG: cell division protein ZapA [Rhodospirillaceae bacterium]|jgi:cell division protein ZapA|nr:cell division protein ZapA [Rhodospirillaceae bacterium]
MRKVHIIINNRGYDVACDEGQESHLHELAQDLAQRIDRLVESVGQIGDARLLLMAALLISDELATAKKGVEEQAARGNEEDEARLADSLERLAARVEAIAARLEAA